MKCVRCQKNPATVKLTRIVKGKVVELNLCQTCAAEVSPFQKKLAAAQGLNALIAHLFKAEEAKKKTEDAEESAAAKIDLKCPSCGLSFQAYKRTLMVGCEYCYDAFGEPLLTDLRKIHGSVQHAGRSPVSRRETPPPPKSIDQLRLELQKAIELEDFERATLLRDQIRALQTND